MELSLRVDGRLALLSSYLVMLASLVTENVGLELLARVWRLAAGAEGV